jgi:hypothetical protein
MRTSPGMRRRGTLRANGGSIPTAAIRCGKRPVKRLSSTTRFSPCSNVSRSCGCLFIGLLKHQLRKVPSLLTNSNASCRSEKLTAIDPPATPSFYAFSYTRAERKPTARSFVAAGSGEAREGGPSYEGAYHSARRPVAGGAAQESGLRAQGRSVITIARPTLTMATRPTGHEGGAGGKRRADATRGKRATSHSQPIAVLHAAALQWLRPS